MGQCADAPHTRQGASRSAPTRTACSRRRDCQGRCCRPSLLVHWVVVVHGKGERQQHRPPPQREGSTLATTPARGCSSPWASGVLPETSLGETSFSGDKRIFFLSATTSFVCFFQSPTFQRVVVFVYSIYLFSCFFFLVLLPSLSATKQMIAKHKRSSFC